MKWSDEELYILYALYTESHGPIESLEIVAKLTRVSLNRMVDLTWATLLREPKE